MPYSLIRKLLFLLDPETAHSVALQGLKLAHQIRLTALLPKAPSAPRNVMGLTFSNPIGLAAGFDKNGDYIEALASLGFGFIEVGTVTPKPQIGNPRPRLFRLPEYTALINSLGFNNKGLDYLVGQLQRTKFKGILGVNIGKNRDTPLEHAIDDYVQCFKAVAPYASYITVNISSPNTPGLRNLQHGEMLQELLRALKQEQAHATTSLNKYVPLVVKISPDLTQPELVDIATILIQEQADGVIATNTTLARDDIKEPTYSALAGGLSGIPLSMRSTELTLKLHTLLQDKIPIIASGGVMSKQDVIAKIAAGATLVQVYTGFIYNGPGWISTL